MENKPKKVGRPRQGKLPKKSYNVYLEPTVRNAIVRKHKSLTKALEKVNEELNKEK